MTNDDLLDLAGNLAANTSLGNAEARFRASVSRAYYGVYHWSVHVLSQFGVDVPGNYRGHDMAKECLRTTGNPLAVEASSLLNDLRGDRNEADYDLQKPRFSKLKNAQLCVESALDAVSNLKKCLEEPARSELEQHFSNSQ